MVWPSTKARDAAQKGAQVGAKLGSNAGPLGAGIGAGFGGASGYIAGSFLPDCPAKKLVPDGGQRLLDEESGQPGTAIPVIEE